MDFSPRFENTPSPLKKFSFAGGFWKRVEDVNRERTIPAVLKFWRETGRIEAIKLQWKEGMPDKPHIFWDSDVAKWIEAAAFSLTHNPDKRLEAEIEDICSLYAKSQSADGYINSYFNTIDLKGRFGNLRDDHELYCAGHLFEAAAALYEATGSRTLLDPALKYARLLRDTFGLEPGKRHGTCGHEEIELALVKLHHATGEGFLLELSKYFIDERGTEPNCLAPVASRATATWPDTHFQAHKPVREQDEAVGHAVRACYLYAGMADIAAETGDITLLDACRKLWDSITLCKMYITGGIGSDPQRESFTFDYDLPNETAYCETCASIALMLFAQRMLGIDPDSKYADVIERALLNNVMAGVSRDGVDFFYANVLACKPETYAIPGHAKFPPLRQKGFGCSCCPPNVARIFASLGLYFHSVSENGVYSHLYGDWDCECELAAGTATLSQRSGYPYDGKVVTEVKTARPFKFDLFLRIPGWASSWTAKLNGRKLAKAEIVKGYLKISREWADGDKVELDLPMEPVAIEAHPLVRQDAGRVAIMRGPLVYCLEEADNGKNLNDIEIDLSKPFKVKMGEGLFDGVPLIEGRARRRDLKGWDGRLYRRSGAGGFRQVKFKAMPYQLWANRGAGEMLVWLRASNR